jgi:hypothetical protein
MKPRVRLPPSAVLLLCLVMTACTPVGGGRERVGELGAAGTAVFVNGRPSSSGTTLYSGDSVTTGPGSSGMVLLATGGIFQIDENTDPLFSWETVAGVRCILVRLLRGQGYVQDTQACISSPAADALAHSAVNIAASPSTTVLTLLAGSLTLQRPRQLSLLPGQEIAAGGNIPGGVQVRTLSPGELQARVAWRMRYRFQGWCGTAAGMLPAWLGDCPGRFTFSHPAAPAATQPPPMPFPPFPPLVPPREPPGQLPPRGPRPG